MNTTLDSSDEGGVSVKNKVTLRFSSKPRQTSKKRILIIQTRGGQRSAMMIIPC